jgi:hypothetical protein
MTASPSSLRKLAASIREEKEQHAAEKAQELKRLSLGGSVGDSSHWSIGSDQLIETHRLAARRSSAGGVSLSLPSLTPASEHMLPSHHESPVEAPETPDASQREPAIAISENKSLENLLHALKEDAKLMNNQDRSPMTASSQKTQGGDPSPSSTIASTAGVGFLFPSSPNSTFKSNSLRHGTPYPKDADAIYAESFHSPTLARADDEGHFRLTPGGSRKILTPSKLSPSPIRVPNPIATDSPARHTRSAEKKAKKSPLTKSTEIDLNHESEENTGEKRKHDDDQVNGEESAPAFLSLRQTGRVSEITMPSSISSKAKRSRRSSISLAESVNSTSTASTTDMNQLLGSLETEKKSSQESAPGTRSMQPSPALAEVSIPRSILSSSRRSLPGSHSRKTVVFGSPQAAEYHIGSPSVSLTPMPKATARAMFSMSSVHGSESSSSMGSPDRIGNSFIENKDETVEIELNMSQLLQNVTTMDCENSSEESSDCETEEGRNTFEDATTPNGNESSPTSETTSIFSSYPNEDETVELEPNIEGLLSANYGSPTNESMLHSERKKSVGDESMLFSEQKKTTAQNESSPMFDSVDMADAESIASLGAKSGKDDGSAEATPQRLNFDGNSFEPDGEIEDSGSAFGDGPDDRSYGTSGLQGDEEDNTIELEADLSSLLSNNDGGRIIAPKPVTLTKKFPKMESSLVQPTNRLPFGEALLAPSPIMTNENTFEHHATGSEDDDMSEEIFTRELDNNSLVQPTNQEYFGKALNAPRLMMTHEYISEGPATGIGDDNVTEQTFTKELETNLESLLKTTGDFDTPSASRRRSSHRFSLTPGSRRLSLSVDGSIALDESVIDMETDDRVDENLNDTSLRVTEEENIVLDLDSKEIMQAVGIPDSSSAMQKGKDSDTLASANTASNNFRNPLIAEAISEFAFAVCGEIEKKAELSSDGNTCFAVIADECPDQLLQLQKALRSLDAGKVTESKEELKRLAQSVQEFVEFEWETWEVQVVESLAKGVEGITIEFEESDDRLESCATLADDALDAVSLMEGSAVQKARRRSLSRRKVRTKMRISSVLYNAQSFLLIITTFLSCQTTSQALAAEIKGLEEQIARERAALETVQAKQHTAASFKKIFPVSLTLSEDMKQTRALAETLQNRFMSLNGMHCWSPLIVDESKIVVGFIGASPKTCIKVSFLIAKTGTITCQASVDSSLFRQRRGKKLKVTPATSLFMEANISTLIDFINNTKLVSGKKIGEMLQRLEMLHGRLEMTANEMFVIQKRYGTMLEADPVGSNSDFLLSVDFKSLCGSMTLRATFELNSSYPFAPLNVSLDDREGRVDVDLLRRQLVKNAKPGFGYLSRTCDTISAFLR